MSEIARWTSTRQRPSRPFYPLVLAALVVIAAVVLLRLADPLSTLMRATGAKEAESASFLLWQLSLPRLLAALLAGGAFALAGTVFQAATRNPLASPDLLGVTAGAQAGMLVGLAVPALRPLAGPPLLFAFGLGAAALALVAAGGWRAAPLRLLLAGGACSLLFSSLVTMTLALFEQNIAGVALWSQGALYQPGAQGLKTATLWLIPPIAVLPFLLRPLEALALGDDAARSIGVAVPFTRLLAALAAAALTAAAVAIAGPIGFIGLLAPNLVRALGLYDLKTVAPLAALTGAALLLAADGAVAGTGLSTGLSTTVATALVGTPLLLALVARGRMPAPTSRGDVATGGRTAPFLVVALACALALIALCAFGLAWGEAWLSPARLVDAVSGRDPIAALILDIRAPRIAIAALTGAMLAASGVVLQSVIRNALAGPEIIGVTQGAALVTLTGSLLWPLLGRPGAFGLALSGGLATLGVILAINYRQRFEALRVALTGLALGGLFAALTYTLIVETSAQPARALIWLVGGTYGRSWADALALLPWFVATLPALALLARPLDLLALGDDAAAGLGLPIALIRGLALLLATILASTAVAIVGPIGFVSLLTPHLARLLGFHRHGARLPIAMLLGALLTVTADIVGRAALAPTEIPAGALTALIGAPYFLWLMIRRPATRDDHR
ncbi:iron complex transport system permease protein [Arboricoccus pini]|uniref:Iron complex transport system permease protein n=1 Tax=Arboricoccus pini TaxID=1963835 RepID=A0A212RK55_9PROT|nr:iron ABC transporter permease [Arboricoccus pini]SNB72829.1 iron complex transport system permease protein [Arboricoccus pini]